MDDFVQRPIAPSHSQEQSSADLDESTTPSAEPVTLGSRSIKAPSQVDQLLELAAGVELFHAPDGAAFATISVNGHRETWPLGRKFSNWLKREFYLKHGAPPRKSSMSEAIEMLEVRAQVDGLEEPVYMRVAEKDGAVYLDLGDKGWHAVAVTPQGWSIVTDPPVKFRRTHGMQPLPEPVHGGHIDELRRFVNVDSDEAFYLLVAWIVGALRPTGPFAMLVLQGEQGSAKSTTARLLRQLIDPSTSPTRRMPREERDLMIAAKNAWVLSFDNLSGLPVWLSDGLCSLATGGGFSTRTLRTDDDEVIFSATRPIILNGIAGVAERPDLADRAVSVSLPSIPDDKRQDEATLRNAFEQASPGILGALLDAVSAALRNFQSVSLPTKPRMADFARWVSAAEGAFGWTPRTFMAVYTRNRAQTVELTLENDIVAVAVQDLLAQRKNGVWEGSATELHGTLHSFLPEHTLRSGEWPKAPNALTNKLGRITTVLRAAGILYENLPRSGKAGRRRLRLCDVGAQKIVSTVSTPNGAAAANEETSTPRSSSATGGIDGLVRPAAGRDGEDRQLAILAEVPEFIEKPRRVDAAGDADDRAAGIVDTAPEDVPQGPQMHLDASSLPALVASIRASGKVGLRVAATGPDLRLDRPCAVALALPSGEIHVVDLCVPHDVSPVIEALCSGVVIGHDLKPDLAHLANEFGWAPGVIFDTETACKLLDGGINQGDPSFGLVETCKRMLGIQLQVGADRMVCTRPLAEEDIADVVAKVQPLLMLEEALGDQLRYDGLEKLAERENERILTDLVTEFLERGAA